jgi:hypothetical protein
MEEEQCVVYGTQHEPSHMFSIIFELLNFVSPEILNREDIEALIAVVFRHPRPPKERGCELVRLVLALNLESLLPPDLAFLPDLRQALVPVEVWTLLKVVSDETFQRFALTVCDVVGQLREEDMIGFLNRCMTCDMELRTGAITSSSTRSLKARFRPTYGRGCTASTLC